jgi:hypothetical protein
MIILHVFDINITKSQFKILFGVYKSIKLKESKNYRTMRIQYFKFSVGQEQIKMINKINTIM